MLYIFCSLLFSTTNIPWKNPPTRPSSTTPPPAPQFIVMASPLPYSRMIFEATCGTISELDLIKLSSEFSSFPRKNAVRLKKFSHKPIRPANRCTAAVFHLNWRTSRVHPKEGRPCATIPHESRPGKQSFCTFDVRTRILVQL